jgi:hypothetical protein
MYTCDIILMTDHYLHEQKVERDQSLSTTRRSLRRKNGPGSIYATPQANVSNFSLTKLNCRTPTIGRESYLLKNVAGREKRTVRLARLKPGFVIGMLSVSFQMDDHSGDHVALTICRLHHLGQEKINELEKHNPRLILELYKMMVRIITMLFLCPIQIYITKRLDHFQLKGPPFSTTTRDHDRSASDAAPDHELVSTYKAC